jgi:SAM-dependent methyltransferase
MKLVRLPGALQIFDGMTNAEAYVEVFHNRLMKPLPDTEKTGEYWGSSSRADFYPYLRKTLSELCTKKGEIKILDVGAGSGEMIEHVIKNYPAILTAIEPNPLMLKSYLKAVHRNNLKLHGTYSGQVQDIYPHNYAQHWFASLEKQDLVLASHMIYGLTSASSDNEIYPETDLITFLSVLYEKLSDNGTIFLVYAIGENTLLGEAALNCMKYRDDNYAANVRKIWQARTELLEKGIAKQQLDLIHPDFECEFASYITRSNIYGDRIEDIAAYCILGELTEIDNSPFDLKKLIHNFKYVKNHAGEFQLHQVPSGQREGMYAVSTPQVVCTIKKRAKQSSSCMNNYLHTQLKA